MKVLVLADQFVDLNGAERLSIELAEALNRRDNISVHLASIYCADMPGGAEALERELVPKGLTDVHFLGLNVHPGPWSFLRALWRLRKLIRREDFDIVETSVTTPSIMAVWATLGLRARHVAGIHFAYDLVRHRGKKDRAFAFSTRINKFIGFYAISDFSSNAWATYSNTPRERTRTIYNGIADASFSAKPDRDAVRDEFDIPRTARIALFVGRFVQTKGLDTLLEALGPIAEKMGIYILLVGGLEQASKSESLEADPFIGGLLQQCDQEGWRARVRFAGKRRDVSRLMASSDLLVHPTRTEGFGLVLVEAMAAGLPIACSDVQGIPEVVKGTETRMTPPDDAPTFRQAVIDVFNRSEEEQLRAIALGRKRAEDFRMETRVDHMIQLFKDVLKKS